MHYDSNDDHQVLGTTLEPGDTDKNGNTYVYGEGDNTMRLSQSEFKALQFAINTDTERILNDITNYDEQEAQEVIDANDYINSVGNVISGKEDHIDLALTDTQKRTLAFAISYDLETVEVDEANEGNFTDDLPALRSLSKKFA